MLRHIYWTGHRIISHLLPALNGCRRASRITPFKWSFSDPQPSKTSLSDSGFARVDTAVSHEWDVTTEEGRAALATLQLYQLSLKGLSPAFASLAILELQEEYLASALVDSGDGKGWDRLARSPGKAIVGRTGVQSTTSEALAVFDATMRQLGADQETSPMDAYAFDVMLTSLVRSSPCRGEGVKYHPNSFARADCRHAFVHCIWIHQRPTRRAHREPRQRRHARHRRAAAGSGG